VRNRPQSTPPYPLIDDAGCIDPHSVSDEYIKEIVADLFPQTAGREIGRRHTLEDLIAVRIGDDFGVILPLLPDHDHLFQRSAELIKPHLNEWSIPHSAPIASGKPSHGYPYHWILVPWVTASTAGLVPLHRESAVKLGSVLREIHTLAPSHAPSNPRTSLPLSARSKAWRKRLLSAAEHGAPENYEFDLEKANALWNKGARAPMDTPKAWTHGRIEPRSIQSDRGRFTGILMWHNFGAGDPAADLGCAFNLMSLEDKDTILSGYGPITPATADRAVAYQLYAALRFVEIGDPYLDRTAWERLIELEIVTLH
jgi:aminoglycoside phosphotransferase (APT) family kinase protein